MKPYAALLLLCLAGCHKEPMWHEGSVSSLRRAEPARGMLLTKSGKYMVVPADTRHSCVDGWTLKYLFDVDQFVCMKRIESAEVK